MLTAFDDLKTDKDSHANCKAGDFVELTRPWCGFQRGDVFYVVAVVPCTGGDVLRQNAHAVELEVYERGASGDRFFQRSLPCEYLCRAIMPGDTFQVDRNQGLRDAWCLARIGCETLNEYEMPNGRTYLFITKGHQDRPVTHKTLPAKWRKELE